MGAENVGSIVTILTSDSGALGAFDPEGTTEGNNDGTTDGTTKGTWELGKAGVPIDVVVGFCKSGLGAEVTSGTGATFKEGAGATGALGICGGGGVTSFSCVVVFTIKVIG